MSNQVENPKVDVPVDEVAQHIDQKGSHVDMVQTFGDTDASAKDGETEIETGEGGHANAYSGDVEDAPKWTAPVKSEDLGSKDEEE